MAGTARALVVVVLVVSAGCAGLAERSLPEELAGYAGDPDNPYPRGNLTVAIDADATDRQFAPLVREALGFWAAADERYLDYAVNFTLAPNARDPDLRVSFVPRVERCGRVADVAGCAPRVTGPAQTMETVRLRVLDDLSADSTVRVLEHELGHALGLGHDDPPADLMATRTTLTALPALNASARTLAWDDPTLSVFLGSDAAADREQIERALAYYDRGADGTVPRNVSFRFVESFESADVVVRVADRLPCGSSGSCGSVFGRDTDRDGALERYARLDISYAGIEGEAVGWHVARRLGLGFGLRNDAAYPPPLREHTGHDHRTGAWWR